MLKMTVRRFEKSAIETYNIAEKRVKLNSKALFHHKILNVFSDNIKLIDYYE